MSKLYALQLPDDLNYLTNDQVQTLIDFTALLYDFNTGKPNDVEAIPQTFTVSYPDIVGTAGYGYKLTPAISLGANLKVFNRRISTKVINVDNSKSVITDHEAIFVTRSPVSLWTLGDCAI